MLRCSSELGCFSTEITKSGEGKDRYIVFLDTATLGHHRLVLGPVLVVVSDRADVLSVFG